MCFVRSHSSSHRLGWIACLSLCASILAAVPASAGNTVVDLVPVRDNTLYQDINGSLSNGAGDHCFAGVTGQPGIRRAVFAFDLTSVPVGSVVLSAEFRLTMDRTLASAGPMTLHRVTASWGEGASMFNDPFAGGGQGAPAQANDCTWLHRFFPTTLWASPGGDFDAAGLATTTVSGSGPYQWGSTSALVSLVQSWVNNPSTNFGWLLQGDEATAPTARRFWTREAASAANRPHLIVTYTALSGAELPGASALRFDVAPNPFNPSTTLRWDSPAAGRARVTVWDVRGALVARPLEGQRPAGPQSFAWQARDARGNSLPSGVYVVQLEQAGETRSRRVVLVR